MTIETLTEFFKWSTIIGMILYAWTAVMSIWTRDFMYKLHQKWFEMSRDKFNITIYAFLGVFKILLILFILVPYLALLIMK